VPTAPLVSVLLAVHNGEPYVRTALESALRQTVSDLELIVVDDASSDATSAIVAGFDDRRVRALRNEEQLGLAASLNRGLDEARGRYVARLDADDVALPARLEKQLRRIRSAPNVAVVGSGVMELDDAGQLGQPHLMPSGTTAVRWAALFSSPFFHPTVLVERDVLERHELRYDADFAESEDYELWTRLLEVADGDNISAPLVLYRVHEGQASQRRRELQRDFQLRVARSRIGGIVPTLSPAEVELAWRVGVGEQIDAYSVEPAVAAYTELLHGFERTWGHGVRSRAAHDLARVATRASGAARARILGLALRLDPFLPAQAVRTRRRREAIARPVRREAEEWLARLEAPGSSRPTRVAAVFPEPTPYRGPLLDRVAALSEIDLTVIYAADTVARRTWRVEPKHRAVFLRGLRFPGAQRVLHHDYPLTPGVVRALTDAHPAVVVISGWSTFAAQAAITWCRLKDVPYVLVVESHDEGPRAGWRRKVKRTVVPPVVQNASGVLVTGTLARNSMVSRGAAPERVRVFANTIDVEGFGERADRLAARRAELRRELGADLDDVVVLSVARLVREKGLDALVRAVAAAADPRLRLVLAGDGPERDRLEKLAAELGVGAVFRGDTDWEKIVELYVAADVFMLLSEREPWAVVVNEAAACGLPLVLSDRVGAAHDLLRDGENGALVPAGDIQAAARALRDLAADPALRRTQGARSRELSRDWGYGPSVDGFLAAVREAVADRR
jgi:glycosyltransferase involved in cell wall biosynthesis/GT2 family glycosyltransferase